MVDDEPWNLELVEAIFEDAGYRMLAARDGVEALAAVERERPDAVLLDVMMPRMDGFDVCRRLKSERRTWFLPVVMLTALDDVASRILGLEAGADEFLSKPIHRVEVLTRLGALLRLRALRDELDSAETIMVSMVTALEGKDPRWRGHSLRVAALAGAAAEALGIDGEAREDVLRGALLHDLGKIGVPEAVLAVAASERTQGERLLYRRHPRYGERILRSLASLRGALPIVRHHHERLDGSGYPDRLEGDDLGLEIEVVAVANAYDGQRLAGDADSARRELERQVAAGRFRAATVAAVLAAANTLPAEPELSRLLPPPGADDRGRILLAVERAATADGVETALVGAGNTVRRVGEGSSLHEAVEGWRPDLLVLDVHRSRRDGVEVCRVLRRDRRFAYLPVILLAADGEGPDRDRALDAGADDFLQVPVDRQELQARVRSLLRLRSYRRDLESGEAVILALSSLLEAKDRYTNGHSERVAELSARLVRELGGGDELAAAVRLGGRLHDLGKVAVPERLLHKPGGLDPAEMAVVRSHPVVGWEICRGLKSVARALPAIRWHHERLDGSGYPDGLAGDAVPVEARVVGLADAWDALTSRRSYRERLSDERAIEILADETARGHWDPDHFAALGALYRRGALAAAGPRGST